MNRDIKFRAQSSCDESWQYGSLFIEENTDLYNHKTKPFNYYILPLNADYEEGNIDCYDVIPETVGQFIERQDSNKIDLYMGDIIVCPELSNRIVIIDSFKVLSIIDSFIENNYKFYKSGTIFDKDGLDG